MRAGSELSLGGWSSLSPSDLKRAAWEAARAGEKEWLLDVESSSKDGPVKLFVLVDLEAGVPYALRCELEARSPKRDEEHTLGKVSRSFLLDFKPFVK